MLFKRSRSFYYIFSLFIISCIFLWIICNKSSIVHAEKYIYDEDGRVIEVIHDDGTKTSYVYDDLGRLISAVDSKSGIHYSYEYDDAGNILSSTDERGAHTYEYDQKGLLSKYDGKTIGDYHGGNPNKYRGYDLSWTMGRVLAGVDQGDRQIEYGYDHCGVRHSKTVDDVKTEYLLNGTTILQQKTGGDVLRFYYGSDASLLEIGYINESAQDKAEKHFVVIKNAMGDVVALTTPEGILVGSYEYDPYGCILSEKSTDADIYGITKMNPFRYRSYYYDLLFMC